MKAKYKELRLLHRTEQTEKKREKPEYTDLSSYSIISCSETILQPDDLWDRFLESQSPEQDWINGKKNTARNSNQKTLTKFSKFIHFLV